MAITLGVLCIAVMGLAAWRGWPQVRFWWLFEQMGLNEQGYPEYRHGQTGIVFVRVPGGTFWMGGQKEDSGGQNHDAEAEENEGPVHEVVLSPFLIAKYETTQEAWEKVMGSNPSQFKEGGLYPVEMVSWNDCQAFCEKTGLRLPTEAEWEYACRAGTPGPYAGTGSLADMGWYDGNSGSKTHPVGQKSANGFGLYDMHGNVWEWCEDVYDEGFYGKAEARGLDPFCASGSVIRVDRGGSWDFHAGICRSASRLGIGPGYRVIGLGFRPALSLP